MTDMTCLAEGLVIPDSPSATGNRNTVVVGATGSGKSVSILYPKLLHTFESSIIVPLTKADVMKKFSVLMEKSRLAHITRMRLFGAFSAEASMLPRSVVTPTTVLKIPSACSEPPLRESIIAGSAA